MILSGILLPGLSITIIVIKDLVILFGAGLMIIRLLVKEIFQILMISPLSEKEELEIAQLL
jgi:hypothetical protein